MAAGAQDLHGEGSMGSEPSQAIFLGYVALGLLIFMVLFVAMVFIGAGSAGFA